MSHNGAPSREQVLGLIRDHLAVRDTRPERVVESASYTRDLMIDSLDLQTLARDLEDEFELVISGEDAITLQTVGETVDFVVAYAGRVTR